MVIDKKYKNRAYVVDFDDLCDNTSEVTYDMIRKVKDEYPDFKCTLFTIPQRTSDKVIEKFKQLNYVLLCPHGYEHTKGECLGWTDEEAIDKINLAKDRGIDGKAFRPPAWLCDEYLYKACKELDYVICTHKDNRYNIPDVKEYVYNDPSKRLKWTRSIHGHASNVCDNYIVDMYNDSRLSFSPKERMFLYVTEAYVQ